MAEAYLQPFFAPTRGLAIRSFSEAANTSEHQFQKYSADFTLFEIAEFDDTTGICTSIEPFHKIGSALEFINQVVSGGPPTITEDITDPPELLKAMGEFQ
jgi:hypothetical protein